MSPRAPTSAKPSTRNDSDRAHYLALLAETVERFGIRIHAYVLMDNHYHLLVETPEANLSRAMQWLNVSYSVWFNRRHNRAGHLFLSPRPKNSIHCVTVPPCHT